MTKSKTSSLHVGLKADRILNPVVIPPLQFIQRIRFQLRFLQSRCYSNPRHHFQDPREGYPRKGVIFHFPQEGPDGEEDKRRNQNEEKEVNDHQLRELQSGTQRSEGKYKETLNPGENTRNISFSTPLAGSQKDEKLWIPVEQTQRTEAVHQIEDDYSGGYMSTDS